ncbi:PP2C family protein-serine/threonine phosphatase [Frankia nepalensis]|uniref:PP2C family protein-serine/threonine phosphatase n=1 Tax=Frankia nepalensis TaxID=1836974 RepID=UPI0027DD5A87|nr:SpoIIE family protein phosphatase [Frankia nepalensis]
MSFTIADPHQPDTPLIWVNGAFTRITGYPFAEAVGRNCRFLQGPRSDRAAAARLGEAQRECRPTRVEILNYRKDGGTFWNEIAIAPVFDGAGRLTHFVGVQDDVTARVEARAEREELYGRAHAVAEMLQRSLLPEMPTVPGLTFVARYLPASDTARVGGDWYDVLSLPDGRVGLAIGDVMGHDLPAAAAMAQLRSTLRAYAWELVGPGEVLERLDRLAQGLAMDSFATVFYAILEPNTSGGATLSYANAGHLPPLLCAAGGGPVHRLSDAHSLLLGVSDIGARDEASVALPPGSTLLLYTDGLVEQRGRDVEDGIDRAAALLAGHTPPPASRQVADSGLEGLADTLTSQATGGEPQQDDIAVLLVRLAGAA